MSTSTDPTAVVRWRRLRLPLAIALLIVMVGGLYGLGQAQSSGGRLDPASATPDGARALATLLEQHGVSITSVDTLDEALAGTGRDSTLLVAVPDALDDIRLDRLRRADVGHLILLEPDDRTLGVLEPRVYPAGSTVRAVREPGCTLPAAERSGAIQASGEMYRTASDADATTCYGDGTRDALIQLPAPRTGPADDPGEPADRTTTVVGTAETFSNRSLRAEGNAALAMNLLGTGPELVWYLPSYTDLTDTAGPTPSVSELLPAPVRAGAAMAGVAIVLILLAAARRLGPVVPEPLPVTVRAADTVFGRARLYRRLRARDRAADGLRQAVSSRLAARLGLPTGASLERLIPVVADRTGRPAVEVADVLAGPAPDSDDALTRLADDLDRIEQEVTRT